MEAARHAEGRAFRADEVASAKTVGGVTRDELRANPRHPKLDADRPVDCICGHATIGEHNHDAFAIERRRSR